MPLNHKKIIYENLREVFIIRILVVEEEYYGRSSVLNFLGHRSNQTSRSDSFSYTEAVFPSSKFQLFEVLPEAV